MPAEHASPVKYFLKSPQENFSLQDIIGKKIRIEFTGNMFCISCGRQIKKTFSQGYCYPCFAKNPENEACVLRPELCLAHEGVARNMEYAEKHCLSEQCVYLASSETIKIGVTRKSQIPFRWIDQGASFAKIIAMVPNRFTAGCMEVEIKKHLPDRTNWRSMLTNNVDAMPNFNKKIDLIKQILPLHLLDYIKDDQETFEFNYPVNSYPQKVSSLDFDKEHIVDGILEGIKGQYFIFNNGRVINIRKYSGYEVEVSF